MKKKAILILTAIFVILIAASAFIKHSNGESFNWLDTISRILAGMLPLLLLFCKRIPFSLPLIISYYLLLFCTFFLGAIVRFYDRFSWWDTLLHFFGSVFMAFIAITLYKLFIPEPVEKKVSSWLIFIFVLSFAISSSVIWESIEFAGTIMGFLESDSNKDTMTDLLAGMAGGIVAAVYALFRKKTANEVHK
ncbi:hypothetical protein [Pseudobacillus wudalianchiensis]|uniref:Membrane-spanning protein n=1 Tax=Pseudobacillus wudalianchiensis TaxID=1743143 RepID=A0A1B9AGC7_9BACI|nr:hypothetical protein [Bacillus wudalianchiensis]OCA82888.1 hypothetical protein A8F95_14275 [Bacillus wudalianchiensis]